MVFSIDLPFVRSVLIGFGLSLVMSAQCDAVGRTFNDACTLGSHLSVPDKLATYDFIAVLAWRTVQNLPYNED